MTISEAKKFGRDKTLKATGVILAILILLFLLGETRGDFANGILFFQETILKSMLASGSGGIASFRQFETDKIILKRK